MSGWKILNIPNLRYHMWSCGGLVLVALFTSDCLHDSLRRNEMVANLNGKSAFWKWVRPDFLLLILYYLNIDDMTCIFARWVIVAAKSSTKSLPDPVRSSLRRCYCLKKQRENMTWRHRQYQFRTYCTPWKKDRKMKTPQNFQPSISLRKKP